jgi:hypothetical protein
MWLAFVGLVLLVALLIPIVGILVDSPIGRALARRLEGHPAEPPPALADLQRKVELLETEVEDLTRAVDALREEHEFVQRLLEDSPNRQALRAPLPPVPPRPSP